MNIRHAPVTNDVQGQATFGMANLRQSATGLPFIVFISQKDDARHAARVEISSVPKVRKDELSSYSIEPFKRREGPALSTNEETLLARWILINKATLIAYWDGDIEYTDDAIAQLKTI